MHFTSRPARQLAIAAGLLGFASLAACNNGGASGDFAKTKSGIEYKIFKNDGGQKYSFKSVANGADPSYKDRIGKVLVVHMEYRTSGDSVLMKSRERQFGLPVRVPLDTIKSRGIGTEQEAFALLQPGDSGVFRFNADTLYMRNAHQLAPANLKKKGNYITLLVKADKLQSRDEAMADAQSDQQKMMAEQQKKMMAYATEQLKKDDAVLQDYIKKNNLTVQKTPSGMYYQILKEGVGPKAKPGQKVSVNYTGSLLSGKVFDSSDKVGKPFEFPLGQGQVIPGWDEGIALLNKGSRAILLIPSTLAYGQRGAGADIPADSPLRFEVELVDVK